MNAALTSGHVVCSLHSRQAPVDALSFPRASASSSFAFKSSLRGNALRTRALTQARPAGTAIVSRQGGGRKSDEEKDAFQERVVQVRRVTKVVKGGKQLSFRAVVVVGDEKGKVGVGCAAAKEVVIAVQKAVIDAKKSLITVPLTSQMTFPHRSEAYFGAAKVMLRPASEGTGVIAGGAVRTVLELAGVKNAFGKQLGSKSPLNNARAALECMKNLKTFKQVAEERGIPLAVVMSKEAIPQEPVAA